MTDAVISYVDSSDIDWQSQYLNTAEQNKSYFDDDESYLQATKSSRFRSYGTLMLQVSLIRKHMSFTDKIHIIVSDEKQVPDEVKRMENVRIVQHSDIIPECKLPIFNSQSIEAFLWKCPEMSEKFIYFNDDMFPIRRVDESDYFMNGKQHCSFKTIDFNNVNNSFRHCCMRSFVMAVQTTSNGKYIDGIIIPQHSPSPMFRSDCEEVFKLNERDILDGISAFRKPWNVNQYLYVDYSALKRGFIQKENDFQYIHLDEIGKAEIHESTRTICVNDLGSDDFEHDIDALKKRLRGFL